MTGRNKIILLLAVLLLPSIIYATNTADISFNHFYGRSVYDDSGFGNNCYLHGGEIVFEGISGPALSLDGVDDYLNLSRPVFGIEYTNAFTVTVWLKVRSMPQSGRSIILQQGYYVYPFALQLEDWKVIRFGVRTESGTHYITSRQNIVPDRWYYIAATYASGEMTLYLDGEKERSEVLSDEYLKFSGWEDEYHFNAGKLPGGEMHYLNGFLDEIKVFNHCIRDYEIRDRYIRESPWLTPGPPVETPSPSPTPEPSSSTTIIHFSDRILEGAVREVIGKPSGFIYKSDVENITEFTATGGVWRLDGLEHFTALETLNLPDNHFDTHVEALSSLQNLKHLDLSLNEWLCDLSALEGVTSLESLNLFGCRCLEDVRPLASLVNLKELNLDYTTNLDDISGLEGLTALESLSAICGDINSLVPLEGLTNLRYLNLYQNSRIRNIDPLSGLINLETLNLGEHYNLADCTPLANLVNLKYLNLIETYTTDLTFASGLINMETLELMANPIVDIYPLLNMKNLNYLGLSYCNHLNQESIDIYIPQLEAQGTEVITN